MHHPLPVKKKIINTAQFRGRTFTWVCYQKALQGYAAKSLSKVTGPKIIRKKSENSPFSVFPIDLHWMDHSVIFSPILVSLPFLLNCRRQLPTYLTVLDFPPGTKLKKWSLM